MDVYRTKHTYKWLFEKTEFSSNYRFNIRLWSRSQLTCTCHLTWWITAAPNGSRHLKLAKFSCFHGIVVLEPNQWSKQWRRQVKNTVFPAFINLASTSCPSRSFPNSTSMSTNVDWYCYWSCNWLMLSKKTIKGGNFKLRGIFFHPPE